MEAAGKAVAYAAEHSRDDLDSDELLRLGLTKRVEIDVLWSTVTEDLPALLEQMPELDDGG